MQSLSAMKQSSTCAQGNCFFTVNKEEKEKKEEKEEEVRRWRGRRKGKRRSQLQCNLPRQCSRVVLWAKAIVSFQCTGMGGGGGAGFSLGL